MRWQVILSEMYPICLYGQGEVEMIVDDEKGSLSPAEVSNCYGFLIQVTEIPTFVPKLDHGGSALEGLLCHLPMTES